MITFEYNIREDMSTAWIQSVYLKEKYRKKGLFTNLLKSNEEYVKNKNMLEKKLKLYMEKDNHVAMEVYFKLGFKVTNEILYELDYYFDKFEDSNGKYLFDNDELSMHELNESNIELIKMNCNNEFINLFKKIRIDLNEHIKGIEKVSKDSDIAKVIIIKNVIDINLE